jgi:hypothetical protein
LVSFKFHKILSRILKAIAKDKKVNIAVANENQLMADN